MVPFWSAHWRGTLPTQANEVLVQGKHRHIKALCLQSLTFREMVLFFKGQKQHVCLCCAVSVGPLLKIIPRLPEKETVYLVHAKLDTADKCNGQPDGYKKEKPSVDKKEILTPALLIRSHLGPAEISAVKTPQSHPALTLTPTLTRSLKVVSRSQTYLRGFQHC